MNSTASVHAPAKLSDADLSQGRMYIQQTRDALLGSVKGVTPSQWEFQPGADRWSVGQIVEHVVVVQERVIGMIRQVIPTAPPPPPQQNRETVDSIVINQFPNRLRKYPSPLPLTHQFDQAGAVRRYAENCAVLTGLLASTEGLREHALDAPPLNAVSNSAYSVMDGYQWILAAAAHAERHTKQILEVIADSAFPV